MNSPVLDTKPRVIAVGERTIPLSRPLAISEFAILSLLSPLVMLIHGYHPFADDGGVYVAGIRKILDPSLFQIDSSFVAAHTRLSLFSHIFAAALRIFQVPLELGLITAYLLSIFAFLLGCLRLAQRIFDDVQLQWGAILLAAALFTLPVAATSLWIMDPYVTARSFSTPISLFALTACIDGAWKRTWLWLLLTELMHPLMAAYLAAFLLAYVLVSNKCRMWLGVACASSFLASGVIYWAAGNASLPDGYREAALSREYFFLSNWHWYEWLGLAIPLLLMLATVRFTRATTVRDLCLTCLTTGCTSWAVGVAFVHTSGSLFLARIQPLRSFQLIYIVGVLLLGGWLAHYLRGRYAAIGAAALLLTSATMLLVQKQVYADSAHVEWPFTTPQNPWQQAFLWIRHHTPQDAVFAIDSNYTKVSTEDTQGFRATTMRSALVDELKDGGVAAIFPALAPRWKAQRDLELGLDYVGDQDRISRLKPASVTWVLLSAGATTHFECPYRNSAVAVCRLP